MKSDLYKLAFVLDQRVGPKTAAMNLERYVQADPQRDPRFFPVSYQADIGLLNLLPLPNSIKRTLRGIHEIRAAISLSAGHDVILRTTESVPDPAEATPAFLRMDMTPVQMKAKEFAGPLNRYPKPGMAKVP